ncbi:hypothetical protein DDO73_13960 [Vibrio cholerae]|uniref:hypothetical protein n=1 Tax=Vibrio cholerae TaxID=666 RepID=UPI0004E2BDA7|nr:hypothetical protein [Vibrio cholerae]EGR4074159.1 hypothetical protein [Vibrio cholerae]KFE28913.1 hypothetical protein DN30_322 [Vibrio cholerae]TXY44009.1 hypothetical protein FXE84_01335 [Vibrio cholerae]HAU9839380.1 hypothetical protein [Vibrio cholerae O1]HDI3249815.1 hypothetical protein [Vibrio cholerae]
MKNPQLVISDSDIDAALQHLNSLPHTVTATMPQPWAKQTFLEWLKESLPKKIQHGCCFDVATGVYAHVVPIGHGLSNYPSDERYLIVLSIRSVNTDLDHLNKIN